MAVFRKQHCEVDRLTAGQDRRGTAQIPTCMCRWCRVNDSTCFLSQCDTCSRRALAADTLDVRSRAELNQIRPTEEPNGTSRPVEVTDVQLRVSEFPEKTSSGPILKRLIT